MNEELKKVLTHLLGKETDVDELMRQIEDVNDTIVGEDMIRRNKGSKGDTKPAVNEGDLKATHLPTQGGQQVRITQRTLQAIADNILTSEAIVTMIERTEKLEQEYKQRMTDLENLVLKLQARVSDVERSEDERLTEKIHEMPANTVLTLDIPDGYQVRNGRQHDIVPMTNGQHSVAEAKHELAGLFKQLRKQTGGNV